MRCQSRLHNPRSQRSSLAALLLFGLVTSISMLSPCLTASCPLARRHCCSEQAALELYSGDEPWDFLLWLRDASCRRKDPTISQRSNIYTESCKDHTVSCYALLQEALLGCGRARVFLGKRRHHLQQRFWAWGSGDENVLLAKQQSRVQLRLREDPLLAHTQAMPLRRFKSSSNAKAAPGGPQQ